MYVMCDIYSGHLGWKLPSPDVMRGGNDDDGEQYKNTS